MTEENREYRTSQIMLRTSFMAKTNLRFLLFPKEISGIKTFKICC